MATWITHLRIAENLLAWLPGLEAGPFAAGNIAPDSGIPDANWEKFTPDPTVTHFTGWSSTPQCADLDFYRCYLLPLKRQTCDVAVFSFRLGYFFHLVTDNLWQVFAYRPAKAKYSAQLAADPKFIEEIRQDWYGQDFIYVRNHSSCLFWKVFLAVQPDTAGLAFLPPDALRQRVEYIQSFYQRTDDEIQAMVTRPMEYLSTAEMDRFVEMASVRLKAVFDGLWVKGIEIDHPHSILDWAMSN